MFGTGQRTHEVVDFFARVLVGEAHAVVCLHDAVAGPLAHGAAQVCLVAGAHWALATVRLHSHSPFSDIRRHTLYLDKDVMLCAYQANTTLATRDGRQHAALMHVDACCERQLYLPWFPEA